MADIIWKLKPFLEAHTLRPRDVETEVIRQGFPFGRNTIYRLTQGEGPTNFNKHTLVALISALRSLTGREVRIGDLLEFRED